MSIQKESLSLRYCSKKISKKSKNLFVPDSYFLNRVFIYLFKSKKCIIIVCVMNNVVGKKKKNNIGKNNIEKT